MPKPVSSFNFNPTGLSVTFTDTSTNAPVMWAWDFGFAIDGSEVTSSIKNPTIIFPAAGVYYISLVAANAEGAGVSYISPVVITEKPTLNFTIQQQVQVDLPGGIAMDTVVFTQAIRKWQLYLQPLVNPIGIPDEDVFNEAKWPPLANVLIAKLIVWELIIKSASAAMVSFSSASQLYNSSIIANPNNTVQVADYSVNFDIDTIFANEQTVVINLIIIDGVSYGPSIDLDEQGLLFYLNSLDKGIFAFQEGKIVSLGNNHILTTFNYTSEAISANDAFIASNIRVIVVSNQSGSVSGGSTGLGKGPLKSLETGPSKAEWYDASTFWSSMFKNAGSAGLSPDGGGGGVIQMLQNEICLFARRMGIRLPFCPAPKKVSLFQIAKKRKSCN